MSPNHQWRMPPSSGRRDLPIGLIHEIAIDGGLEIVRREGKTPISCPFHFDTNKSAFLSDRNIFFCSVCTPGRGWSARRFAMKLSVPWGFRRIRAPRRVVRLMHERPCSFSGVDAGRIWTEAQGRAVSEVQARDHDDCREYLRRRLLDRNLAGGLVGFLGPSSELRQGGRSWYDLGVRLVAPLFDLNGSIQNVQGRNVLGRKPRLLFPTGSKASQCVFANPRGLAVLRQDSDRPGCVLLAEGMTDFIALATVPQLAVLGTPGAGNARSAIGEWVRNLSVVLALDGDSAGERATELAANAAWRLGAARVRAIQWPADCKDACELLTMCGVDGLDLFVAEHIAEARHG
jgi:hypothetical protein